MSILICARKLVKVCSWGTLNASSCPLKSEQRQKTAATVRRIDETIAMGPNDYALLPNIPFLFKILVISERGFRNRASLQVPGLPSNVTFEPAESMFQYDQSLLPPSRTQAEQMLVIAMTTPRTWSIASERRSEVEKCLAH
jgi:hypothetical protein